MSFSNDLEKQEVDLSKLQQSAIIQIMPVIKCKYKLPCGWCDLKNKQCDRHDVEIEN